MQPLPGCDAIEFTKFSLHHCWQPKVAKTSTIRAWALLLFCSKTRYLLHDSLWSTIALVDDCLKNGAPDSSCSFCLGRKPVTPNCTSSLHKLRNCLIVIASLWNTKSFLLFQRSQQHKMRKPSKCAAGICPGCCIRCGAWLPQTNLALYHPVVVLIDRLDPWREVNWLIGWIRGVRSYT